MDKFLQVVGAVVLVAIAVVGLSLLMALPTEWAWNVTMPYLFGWKPISLLRAFALNVLAGMLVKSSLSSPSK